MIDEFSEDDLTIDRELADIDASYRLLLDVTPVCLAEARSRFCANGRTPDFMYRPLDDDPVVAIQRLDKVAVDMVHDATLASLFKAKQRELRLELQMRAYRGTEHFLPLSIELYGTASPALLAEAEHILSENPPVQFDEGPWLDAQGFLEVAQAELNHYRAVAPDIESRVEICEGSSGLMVSQGDLLVAPTVRVPTARVEALLHHEIGTHIVTHVNGAKQPLQLLAGGLAGAEETQEGLAVLAEYLVSGLTAGRLRQLAARVVAVHWMVNGATFPQVHSDLVDAGLPPDQAFMVATRVFRAGGLTKDVVYLRGLHELVHHLGAGRAIDGLWLCKMPLAALPLVGELHQRGALVDPLLTPRFLNDPRSHARLKALEQAVPLTALIAAGT